jgi:hypothetical protein
MNDIEMLFCKKCQTEHPKTTEFWCIRENPSRFECKIQKRIFYQKNKERLQQAGRVSAAKYRLENPEYNKKYREQNRDIYAKSSRNYYQKNKKSVNARMSVYTKERKKKDPSFRLALNCRARIRNALKGMYKNTTTAKLIGCSWGEFKEYIESKFQPGMTWDNYGRNGWHIDHIIPLCSFDLSDTEQLQKACHYSNLQPLWAKDNLIKNGKY